MKEDQKDPCSKESEVRKKIQKSQIKNKKREKKSKDLFEGPGRKWKTVTSVKIRDLLMNSCWMLNPIYKDLRDHMRTIRINNRNRRMFSHTPEIRKWFSPDVISWSARLLIWRHPQLPAHFTMESLCISGCRSSSTDERSFCAP